MVHAASKLYHGECSLWRPVLRLLLPRQAVARHLRVGLPQSTLSRRMGTGKIDPPATMMKANSDPMPTSAPVNQNGWIPSR
ncbi:hypothetical protein NXT3_PA00215 (plasmid) [Sinorhizobium fredii]|uniref:Uncharacterized protein n=1 Tax=Rhizobium fredii TaxID=380 RepID=A0A2L0HAK4_RHIFR|nr:hypothetical protein NXT3_PA00215 [Sinorhizobium fredii]